MLNQETETKNLSIEILKILGMYLAYLSVILLSVIIYPLILLWLVLLVAPIIAGISICTGRKHLHNSTIIAIAIITISQTWADGIWMRSYAIPFEILLILSILSKFKGRELVLSLILAIAIPLSTLLSPTFHPQLIFPIINKTINIQTCTNQIEKDGKVISPPVCTWGDYKVVDVSVSHADFSHRYILMTHPHIEYTNETYDQPSETWYIEGLKKGTIKGDYAVKAWYTFDFLMPINSLFRQ